LFRKQRVIHDVAIIDRLATKVNIKESKRRHNS
jgi:hypothetical protein